MSKMTKCKSCGKYEIKCKPIKIKKDKPNLFPELINSFQKVSEWKWCTLKNNWCRYVANHCDYIPANKQQLKKENLLEEFIK